MEFFILSSFCIYSQAEREKTLGKKWFDMKAPDKDDPARMDMELIRMRGVLDPKRFYKGQDRKATPKYFQVSHRKKIKCLSKRNIVGW